MKIHVTRADIRKGILNCLCPVKLTLERITRGTWFVGPFVARQLIDYPLPRSARRFIKRFDLVLPVKPFKFILRGLNDH